MHTAKLDSTVGCTLQSLTPQCNAHCRAFLKIQISRQNPNWIRKYFSLFFRGPDGFKSWKKYLMTHSLKIMKRLWFILNSVTERIHPSHVPNKHELVSILVSMNCLRILASPHLSGTEFRKSKPFHYLRNVKHEFTL